jgi:pimeloyl-ACP methyl ester carboxylesterase
LAFLATLGALYGAVAGLATAAQKRLIYPAPGEVIEPHAPGAELWRLPGHDGRTVFALYAKAPPGAPTVVHFHGNGEQLSDQAPLVRALAGAGLGACAVEYPGYGLSRANAVSEQAIYADAQTALRHLASLGVPDSSIVLEGQSLGTGVAVEMARRGYGSRLVLISPYTSIVDMARRVAPFLPVSRLVSERFDTASKARSIALPALVIHGEDDEIIPVSMGRVVAKLLPHAALVIVAGGHHNDLFAVDGRDLIRRIVAFARDSPHATR